MSRIPKPHEIYRHFKGNQYQVLAVAEHTETGEELVIYQAMYGEFKIYARPLKSFTEELDKEKYPSAGQKHRFELLKEVQETEAAQAKEAEPEESTPAKETEPTEELNIDPMVLAFLDANTYEERLQILASLHNRITDDIITTMAVACDIEVPDGELEERFYELRSCLITLERFECNRLR